MQNFRAWQELPKRGLIHCTGGRFVVHLCREGPMVWFGFKGAGRNDTEKSACEDRRPCFGDPIKIQTKLRHFLRLFRT